MFWKRFDKKKPTEKGWYMCTVEVPNQQRYVMDLYWYPDRQKFIDNRRQTIFDDYTVTDYEGKRLHSIGLCDRTSGVVAWRKMPKTYMRGFEKKSFTED